MKKHALAILFIWAIALSGSIYSCSSEDSTPNKPVKYSYENPVKETSPWPSFRRTMRNTGYSPVIPSHKGMKPWTFKTGKGMFHSPVIDEDGTIYMGSADTYFYALTPEGKQKWSFKTGEIIDSSALIGADGTIYAPAGDGYLYALNPDGTLKWKLQSPGQSGYITWWEGHVSMDAQGTLFAGNDDYRLYAIGQDGTIKWSAAANDQVWSCAGFAPNGYIFFGSNDGRLRAVDHTGAEIGYWLTLGPVTSSPAVSADGAAVYFGSFDGYIYAVNPEQTFDPLWSYPARDHIYGSAAIAEDGTICIGSADGTLYCLNPDGTLKFAYDILDPIRSSVAIDGEGTIYFGAGDGRLYAINPDGTRKWSYNTTISDRNDLNGSPALGLDGVYIGAESGEIHFIPYDFCEKNKTDAKCSLKPEEDIPNDGVLLYSVTPAGSSNEKVDFKPAPMDALTFRLALRSKGETAAARFQPESVKAAITPTLNFRTEISANGQFVNVIPLEAMKLETEYSIELSGKYLVGGKRRGNRVEGGEVGGDYKKTFIFTTAPGGTASVPFSIGESENTTLRLRRLAVTQPPMMTTFNQIGFDSYNYLMSVISMDAANKRFVMLAAEGTPGLEPVVNKQTKSIFVLEGSYSGKYFNLESSGFAVDVTGVAIALDLFRVSGFVGDDLSADGLNIFAEVKCSNVESFGSQLDLVGLCHPQTNMMVLNGTAMLSKHPGPEGKKPAGLTVKSVETLDAASADTGKIIKAAFDSNALKADEHMPAIVLFEKSTGAAAQFKYGLIMEKIAGANGVLEAVTLTLPKGLDPAAYDYIVTVDLFPLAKGSL